MKWNYSSTEECESLFASSAARLRWLCLTLTANEELADRAFESALQQSLKGASRVFQQWMASWARRQIIKSCIAIMRPAALRVAHCACSCHEMELVSADVMQADILPNLSASALQRSLLRLDVLSRFVFVLRALEGYSRRDTALLLSLRDADCEAIYSQAAHQLHLEATATQSAEETAISVNEELGQLECSVVAGSWSTEQLSVAA